MNRVKKLKKRVLYLMTGFSLALLQNVVTTSCSGCMGDFGHGYTTLRIDSTTDVVYDRYIAVDEDGWKKGDSLVFDIPLFENPADLEVSISVRHTNFYPYQNLQIQAFLAEQDTTNIINSLPIRQNDSRIDSLIRREDSLKRTKELAEHFLQKKVTERDSMMRENRDSLLQAERADSLRLDSLRNALRQKAVLSSAQRDSLKNDSLKNDSARADSLRRLKEAALLAEARRSDSIRNVVESLTHNINFTLYNQKDKKRGVGMMFMETSVDCGTIHLKANTRYKIIISHNMMDHTVRGVSDVGIQLRRDATAKPLFRHTRWW